MSKILVRAMWLYRRPYYVDLIQNGFEVICVDDLSRGSVKMLEGIEKITGKKVKN